MDNPNYHLPNAIVLLAKKAADMRQQAKDLRTGEKEQEKEHITPLFIMFLVLLFVIIIGAISFLLIKRNS